MIEQPALLQKEAPQKVVASGGALRQLSRMRGYWPTWILAIALSGCSLPAPYQTYSPVDAPAAIAAAEKRSPPQALVVYGGTTTSSEMIPDTMEPEPLPGAAAPTPTPTAVPAPSQAQASPLTPQRVAICYNRLWNKPDTVKGAATQACGNSSVRIESQTLDLDACPMLTPTKAVFSCTASAGP